MKGEEAKVAMEELVSRQAQVGPWEGEAPDERALMNQIVQLERELRERDRVMEAMRERGSSPTPGAANELRVLRQENEDLRVSYRVSGASQYAWFFTHCVRDNQCADS